jgi:hypothetical protein
MTDLSVAFMTALKHFSVSAHDISLDVLYSS